MAIELIGVVYALMTAAFWASIMVIGYKAIRLVVTLTGILEADPAASKGKSRK